MFSFLTLVSETSMYDICQSTEGYTAMGYI